MLGDRRTAFNVAVTGLWPRWDQAKGNQLLLQSYVDCRIDRIAQILRTTNVMIGGQDQQKRVRIASQSSVCRQGDRRRGVLTRRLENNRRLINTDLTKLLCYQKPVLIVANNDRISLL